MSYCPSQDWDRHISELDAAAEEEMAFYATYRDDILRVVLTLIQSNHPTNSSDIRKAAFELIDDAAIIVQALNERCEA